MNRRHAMALALAITLGATVACGLPVQARESSNSMIPEQLSIREREERVEPATRREGAMDFTREAIDRFVAIRDRRMEGAPPAMTVEEQVQGYYRIIVEAVEEMGYSFQETLMAAMLLAEDRDAPEEERMPALQFLSDGIQFHMTIALYPDKYLEGKVLDEASYAFVLKRLSMPDPGAADEGWRDSGDPFDPPAAWEDMDEEQRRLARLIAVYETQLGFVERSIERLEKLARNGRERHEAAGAMDPPDAELLEDLEAEIAFTEQELEDQELVLKSKRALLERQRQALENYTPGETFTAEEEEREAPYDTPEGFVEFVDGVAGIPWGTDVSEIRGLAFMGVTDSGIEKYDLGNVERLYFFDGKLGGYNWVCPLERRPETYTYIDETFSFSYMQMGVYYYYLHGQVDVTVNERKGIVRVEYLPIIEAFHKREQR